MNTCIGSSVQIRNTVFVNVIGNPGVTLFIALFCKLYLIFCIYILEIFLFTSIRSCMCGPQYVSTTNLPHVNVIVLCFGLLSHLFGHPDTNIYEL